MARTAIFWFRRDLRLRDNPGWQAACAYDHVLPVFIYAPDEEEPWSPGAASQWWLHHSLVNLQADLRAEGSDLLCLSAPSLNSLERLIKETGAEAVFWNRCYEPAMVARDKTIKAKLQETVQVESYNSSLLAEPWEVLKQDKTPYLVYTPYWRAFTAQVEPRRPIRKPKTPALPKGEIPDQVSIEDLGLLPQIKWDTDFYPAWTPSEASAKSILARFKQDACLAYNDQRDQPGVTGTSRLSPFLHWGNISPQQVWHAVVDVHGAPSALAKKKGAMQYLKELVWREFSAYLLFHFPHLTDEPLREEFKQFPWHDSPEHLRAWTRGQTGYPIVDAGMRELWTTGWMHNRVRMVVASFLVKHLLIPWQEGAKWFWDTLVDADLASNTQGWQWTAGCGADAAPYFRIFNPMIQGEKFDKEGSYVRQWVPELERLDKKWIHRPWEAPAEALEEAGITLGTTYPQPLIEHGAARNRALRAYDKIKKAK